MLRQRHVSCVLGSSLKREPCDVDCDLRKRWSHKFGNTCKEEKRVGGRKTEIPLNQISKGFIVVRKRTDVVAKIFSSPYMKENRPQKRR